MLKQQEILLKQCQDFLSLGFYLRPVKLSIDSSGEKKVIGLKKGNKREHLLNDINQCKEYVLKKNATAFLGLYAPFVVLDIDSKEALSLFEGFRKKYTAYITVSTLRGGLHCYYKDPEGIFKKKLQIIEGKVKADLQCLESGTGVFIPGSFVKTVKEGEEKSYQIIDEAARGTDQGINEDMQVELRTIFKDFKTKPSRKVSASVEDKVEMRGVLSQILNEVPYWCAQVIDTYNKSNAKELAAWKKRYSIKKVEKGKRNKRFNDRTCGLFHHRLNMEAAFKGSFFRELKKIVYEYAFSHVDVSDKEPDFQEDLLKVIESSFRSIKPNPENLFQKVLTIDNVEKYLQQKNIQIYRSIGENRIKITDSSKQGWKYFEEDDLIKIEVDIVKHVWPTDKKNEARGILLAANRIDPQPVEIKKDKLRSIINELSVRNTKNEILANYKNWRHYDYFEKYKRRSTDNHKIKDFWTIASGAHYLSGEEYPVFHKPGLKEKYIRYLEELSIRMFDVLFYNAMTPEEFVAYHKFGIVCIGDQNAGKSLIVNNILPTEIKKRFMTMGIFSENYSELINSLKTFSTLICEDPEMVLDEKKTNKISKMIIGASNLTGRPLYGKFQEYTNKCIFIGTVNDQGDGVLPEDKSGQYRWMPVFFSKNAPLSAIKRAETAGCNVGDQKCHQALWIRLTKSWDQALKKYKEQKLELLKRGKKIEQLFYDIMKPSVIELSKDSLDVQKSLTKSVERVEKGLVSDVMEEIKDILFQKFNFAILEEMFKQTKPFFCYTTFFERRRVGSRVLYCSHLTGNEYTHSEYKDAMRRVGFRSVNINDKTHGYIEKVWGVSKIDMDLELKDGASNYLFNRIKLLDLRTSGFSTSEVWGVRDWKSMREMIKEQTTRRRSQEPDEIKIKVDDYIRITNDGKNLENLKNIPNLADRFQPPKKG